MNADLAVHDTGSGPAVLLLHAFPLDASMWDAQVAALSGHHRCLRPDAPGCGASPPPAGPLTVDGLAAAIVERLESRGVTRFAVAGISMGGYLAMALLRVVPERVTGVALLSTRAAADGDSVRSARTALAADLRAGGREAVEAIVEPQVARLLRPGSAADYHVSDPVRARIRRCSPAGLAALAEMMRERPDSTRDVAAIRVPALVVAGDADAVTPLEEQRSMAAAIPGARLEVVERAGHLVTLEHPQESGRLLRDWLDRVAAAA